MEFITLLSHIYVTRGCHCRGLPSFIIAIIVIVCRCLAWHHVMIAVSEVAGCLGKLDISRLPSKE